eukprot:1259343-Karenia_brevis.AAC.1
MAGTDGNYGHLFGEGSQLPSASSVGRSRSRSPVSTSRDNPMLALAQQQSDLMSRFASNVDPRDSTAGMMLLMCQNMTSMMTMISTGQLHPQSRGSE